MDESSKLALAVVAAAVISIGGYVGYNEYSRSRDIDQAQQMLTSMRQDGQRLASQVWVSQQQQPVQYQTIYQYRDQQLQQERHLLDANQRCVDGAVVVVRGNSYTQVGTIDHPVHCSGRYADVPLR